MLYLEELSERLCSLSADICRLLLCFRSLWVPHGFVVLCLSLSVGVVFRIVPTASIQQLWELQMMEGNVTLLAFRLHQHHEAWFPRTK